MSRSTWAEFWRNEESSFFPIMRMSTSVFARRFINHFNIREHHAILDYGCGPGFLVGFLAHKKPKVIGVDINDYFVTTCIQQNPQYSFYKIPEGAEELNEALEINLQDKKFDFIILLSVAQYIENEVAFEKMIGVLKMFLKKGGSIVLADVVTPDTSSLRDLLAVTTCCLSTGNIINLFRFILYLTFSSYRSLSKRVKLQSYTDQDIISIAKACNLTVKKIEGLTLHPTRVNYTLSL